MNRIIAKAAWLMHEGRIIKISDKMYYVVGRRNRHIVRVDNGKLSCTCDGFRERNVCSHVIAVSTMIKFSGGENFDEFVKNRVLRELKLLGRQPIR